MIKNEVYNIGNNLITSITKLKEETIKAFQRLGEIFGEYDQIELQNKPFTLITDDDPVNIENLISKNANFNNPNQKGVNEIMQRIKTIKNAHIRKDGRFEWRKMIKGKTYQVIDKNFETFSKRVSEIKKNLKGTIKNVYIPTQKITLTNLCEKYFERNIESQVKKGTLKNVSAKRYLDALKYLQSFDKEITYYTKDDIIDYLNNIKQHRTGAYCYYLLKRVFADEYEKGNIKRDIIATLKNPFTQKRCMKKGSWLNIQEQQILKDNLNDSVFHKEILFYLMTGCRLQESYDAKIDFEKHIVHINRHKTEFSGVKETVIPLSIKFCEYIKNDWQKMFKITPTQMSGKITKFFHKIGIYDKSTHDLRHTFSTNLYYLGIDPKRQQYLMGHASIKQTFDTYTTLDIAVTKQDILNLWGDLYPEF